MDSGEALLRARAYESAGRPKEALNEIRRALAVDPEDPELLFYASRYATELDDHADAMGYAKTLVGVAPDLPLAHFQLGVVYLSINKVKEAEEAMRAAIGLDPQFDDAWAVLSIILTKRSRHKEALEAAETALAIDAENSTALNSRTVALNNLGRRVDAMDAAKMAARQLPDDTNTHQMMGWTALRSGRANDAMESFKEALRLDPTDQDAREGLLEALRGRFWPYRILLNYYFWMSRFGTQARWAIAIGITILPRALRGISAQYPQLGPFLLPLAAVVVIFIWTQWFLAPLINVSLLFHKLGRYALTKGQTANALCILVLLATTLVLSVGLLLAGRGTDAASAVAIVGAICLFCLGGLGTYSKTEGLLKWGSVAVLVIFELIQLVVFLGVMLRS